MDNGEFFKQFISNFKESCDDLKSIGNGEFQRSWSTAQIDYINLLESGSPQVWELKIK